MKAHWMILAACSSNGLALAQGDALVTSPAAPAKNAHAPAATLQPTTQQLVNGSDSCSTADPITGLGVFTFDTNAATTGTEGQFNTNCNFFTQIGIFNDVWFLWTAPSTGSIKLSTVGQTALDSKISIYNGAACPLPSTGGTSYACNDDQGAGTLQTSVFFDVVASNQYLIQLGSFAAAGLGSGTFTVEYRPIAGPSPCQQDDGNSDIVVATGAVGAEICWLQSFGRVGDVTTVAGIQAAFGGAFYAPNNTFLNGVPIKVAIWDDPNDDYNPADCVFLQSQTGVSANVDTDLFNTYALSPAVTVNGVYFIGVTTIRPNPSPANWFPISGDGDGAWYEARRAWRCSNASGVLDFNNLAANSTPPAAYSDLAVTLANNGFNIVMLLRPDCPAPNNGTPFCFGDGTLADHTTPCPCANNGAAGNGCANSVNPNGANLTGSGTTLADNVVLQGSGMPATVSCIYLQGNALDDLTFGDGTRCTGGTLIRLRTRANVGGASAFPDSTDTITLSARGGVVPGSGATRHYQTYYRNSAAIFCPPETFNVTNGRTIVW